MRVFAPRTYLALNVPLITCHPILQSRTTYPFFTTMSSRWFLMQCDDFCVIRHDRTVLNGGHNEGDIHTGVIVLSY